MVQTAAVEFKQMRVPLNIHLASLAPRSWFRCLSTKVLSSNPHENPVHPDSVYLLILFYLSEQSMNYSSIIIFVKPTRAKHIFNTIKW